MKRLFEFKDEKSSKFWEIDLDGESLTTRYGKIGTEGQISRKTISGVISARKEYERLVKEKLGKGYQELALPPEQNAEPASDESHDLAGSVLMPVAELKTLAPKAYERLKDWGESAMVHYYENDKLIDSEFNLDSYHAEEALGFVFAKDLTVNGDIVQMEINSGPHLLVVGHLRANHIDKSGSFFEVLGDCTVKGLIYGYFNDGMLKVDGIVSAPYIISDDQPIEYGAFDEERLIAEIDVYHSQLDKLFVSELIRDEDRIDTELARRMLDEGKPILRNDWEIVDRDDEDDEDAYDEEESDGETDEENLSPDSEDTGLTIALCDMPDDADGLVLGIGVSGSRVCAVGGQGEDLLLLSQDGLRFEMRDNEDEEDAVRGNGLRSACLSGSGLWVVGEYGYVAHSEDHGKSWKRIKIPFHGCLFGIAEDAQGTLWIAGDNGYIAYSNDRKHFTPIEGVPESIARISASPLGILVPTDSPGHLYIIEDGTLRKTSLKAQSDLMSARVTRAGTLIAVGHQGGLFRSTDQGKRFTKIETDTKKTLTCAGELPNGMLFAFGKEGLMLASLDDGESFVRLDQEVCESTIWCCTPYGEALLLGAEHGEVYRFGFAEESEQSDPDETDGQEEPLAFGEPGQTLSRIVSAFFPPSAQPIDTSALCHPEHALELNKWRTLCGRFRMDAKELEGFSYGAYGFDELLSVAREEADGKLVAGFRSIFCAVQTIAEGEEEAAFATLGSTPYGTSLIYTTHQDEFEDFRYGTMANSIASWLYRELAQNKKRVRRLAQLLNDENDSGRERFEQEAMSLPSHLDPARLSQRTDWLVHIFVGVSDSDDIMESFEQAGTVQDYEGEKDQIATWPHLAAYWLLSHLILENRTLLEETVTLSQNHEHPAVSELLTSARQYLQEGSVEDEWWLDAQVDDYRTTIQSGATPEFFAKADYTRIQERLSENKE